MSTPGTWTPRKIGTVIGLLLFAAALVVIYPLIDRARQRAELADAIGQLKSLKFALDGFANDFDGQFPNVTTGEHLGGDQNRPPFSNGYFRQLFLAGETSSERIFWTSRSPVTGAEPDDEILGPAGTIDPGMILQAGECHWAYVSEQGSTSNQDRPLVLDPFLPGQAAFDPTLWDRKAVIVTIDGGTKAHRLTTTNKVVDGSGRDLFAPDADAWERSKYLPEDLLVQPHPAPGR